MSTGLNIITNDAGELVRGARARDTGEEVLVAVHRLATAARVHDVENQAFTRQLEQTHRAILYYCLHAGTDLTFLFGDRVVLIGGHLLKGSRAAYEAAAELGDRLMWCGGAELTILRDVSAKDLRAFVEALTIVLRGKKSNSFTSPTPKIRLRAVSDAVRVRGLTLERLRFEQRLVRTYASAVVAMRRLFEGLQAGRRALPRRIKRIAQSLVDLSEGNTPAFLGVTEVRNANHDEAGRAVNTAILAVATARALTPRRVVLAQIAMAALLHDVGRPRASAKAGVGPIVARLSDQDEKRLPAGAAAVLTALGRLNSPTIARTVVVYESLWLGRTDLIGPVYGGMLEPTLQARIVMIARRYNDLITPEPGLDPPTPDHAIAVLSEELAEPTDQIVVRLLVSALRLMPAGTLVRLSTGETAEVVPSTGHHVAFKPRVKVVVDALGAVVNPARVIDLEDPPPEIGPVEITKVLSVDGWKRPPETRGEGTPQADLDDGEYRDSEHPPPPSASTVCVRSAGRVTRQPERSPGLLPPPTDATECGTDHIRCDSGPPLQEQLAGMPPISPSATGTLSATPLTHVLVYIMDRELSGTLILRPPDGSAHVAWFDRGTPVKIRTGQSVALIGEELVAQNVVSGKVIEHWASAAKREGMLLCDFLMRNGLLPEEALTQALKSQLLHRIEWLVGLPNETAYEFYKGFNALQAWGAGGVTNCESLDVILTASRAWKMQSRMSSMLARLADHPVVLHPEAEIASLSFTEDEKRVLAVIQANTYTLDSLQNAGIADQRVVTSLLYALLVTRQLVIPGQRKPPIRSRPVVVEPPTDSAPRQAVTDEDFGRSSVTSIPERPAQPLSDLVPIDVSGARDTDGVPDSQGGAEEDESAQRPTFPSLVSFGTSPSAVADSMDGMIEERTRHWSARQDNQDTSQLMSIEPPATQEGMDGSGAAKGVATGTLQITPIVHILVYMLDHAKTGSLVVREPEGCEHVLYFREGGPRKVRTGRPIALLGELLVAHGFLDSHDMDSAVEEARSIEAPLGEYLVLQGMVSRPLMERVLQEQIADKYAALVNLSPETTYNFLSGVNLLETWGGKVAARCPPLQVLLGTVRAWSNRARIRGTLGRMRDRKLRLHPQADMTQLVGDPNMEAVVNVIADGDLTIGDLYHRGIADEEEINALVYSLAVTRHFTFTAHRGPPMGIGPIVL